VDSLGRESAPATVAFTVRETPTVRRVTANDAAGYSAKLSAIRTSSSTTAAVLVGSGTWTNAAIAAPLARVIDGPVLVTGSKSVPAATRAELKRLGVTDIIIVGTTHAVSASVTKALDSAGYHVTRVSGADRYSAGNAVAREIARRSGGAVPNARAVIVGDSAADALSASAVAARKGWPLLFARSASVPSATRSTLNSLDVTSTVLVARTSTVSNTAKGQLPSATRISASSSAGVGTALASWATAKYPADFSGERVFLANPAAWDKNLGLGAEAARQGELVLTTGKTIAGSVKSYYTLNSEVAVRTRVIGGASTIANSAVTAIKKLVGAP
jgi:lactocepin